MPENSSYRDVLGKPIEIRQLPLEEKGLAKVGEAFANPSKNTEAWGLVLRSPAILLGYVAASMNIFEKPEIALQAAVNTVPLAASTARAFYGSKKEPPLSDFAESKSVVQSNRTWGQFLFQKTTSHEANLILGGASQVLAATQAYCRWNENPTGNQSLMISAAIGGLFCVASYAFGKYTQRKTTKELEWKDKIEKGSNNEQMAR